MGRSASRLALASAALLWSWLLVAAYCLQVPDQGVNQTVYSFPPFFANASAADLTPSLVFAKDEFWSNIANRNVCHATNRSGGSARQQVQQAGVSLFYSDVHDGLGARLTLKDAVRFYNSTAATSFDTFFLFSMESPEFNYSKLNFGLVFLIVPRHNLPSDTTLGTFEDGLFVVTPGTGAHSQGDNRTFSVEIDVREDGYDPAVPHVGVNLDDSLESAKTSYLWDMSQFLNRSIAVWIQYSARQLLLRVWIMNVSAVGGASTGADAAVQLRREDAKLVLSYPGLDLSTQVPEDAFVGFGATVPLAPTIISIYNWTFVAAMDSPRPNRGGGANLRLILLLVLGGLGAVVLLVAAGAWCLMRRKCWSRSVVAESFADHLDVPKEFSYSQLRKATCNFSNDNVIGEGGFGKVFKGVLDDEDRTVVAVKRVHPSKLVAGTSLDGGGCQGVKAFIAELTTIGSLRHRNIVPLRGWCQHDYASGSAAAEGSLLLVYDYMPNGSLEQHLQLSRGVPASDSGAAAAASAALTWEQRHKILRDIAAALLYLHCEGHEGRVVVHRDIKPSNVLLDADMSARLSDFGLARKLTGHSKTVSAVAGTMGYLAPEVIVTSKVSAESDIYSFGVVVLEVACGRRAIEWWRTPVEERILVPWVLGLARAGRLVDAADPALRGHVAAPHLIGLLRLGLLCCIAQPEDRPSIRLVSRYLTAAPDGVGTGAAAPLKVQLPDPATASYQHVYYAGPASLEDWQDMVPPGAGTGALPLRVGDDVDHAAGDASGPQAPSDEGASTSLSLGEEIY